MGATMGIERVKRMNQSFASVNTLNQSGNKREFSGPSSVPHQNSAKRQKLSAHSRDGLLHETWKLGLEKLEATTDDRNPQTAHAGSTRPSENKAQISVDIYDPDPSPSRVVSDIAPRHRGPKRRSTNVDSSAHFKHASKRREVSLQLDEIETSEDELQSNHSTIPSRVRHTQFSRIQSSPRRMRGNIISTKFDDNGSKGVNKVSIDIVKAVSGSYSYCVSDSNCPQLSLHRSSSDSSLLEAWANGTREEEHQWVSFNVKDVRNVRYGGCYLHFRRSMLRGRPPTITLQFASPQGAAQVAEMIVEGLSERQTDTREELKKILDVSWKKAAQSSRPASREDDDTRQVNVTRDWSRHSGDEETQTQRKSPQSNSTARSAPLEERRRSASPARRIGMETRRTRRSSRTRKEIVPSLERWSKKNTGWDEDWKQTLVYPASGRNRTSVEKEDILKLDEGEFLNDNLINFYLRYLQTNIGRDHPEFVSRVHIMSTFFFEKLTSRKGGINYDGVKSWTSKVDLFSYDYVVVPVNENAHWYLAIICNTSKLLAPTEDEMHVDASTNILRRPKSESLIMMNMEQGMTDVSLEDVTAPRRSSRQLSSGLASSPSKIAPEAGSPPRAVHGSRTLSKRTDASMPRIITLDSLGITHSATCKVLKEYLVEEAKDKKNINLAAVPVGKKARGIPEQDNFCDCGVFVLGYMDEFLKDPDTLVRKILAKEHVGWSINAARLRDKVREILFGLQKEQTDRLAQEREAKRQKKRTSAVSGSSASETALEALPPRSSDISQELPTPRPPPNVWHVSDDEGAVAMVEMPAPAAQAADETGSQPSAKRAHKTHAHQRQPKVSPPPASPGDTQTQDTQDSVQLLSVVARSPSRRKRPSKSARL
ncbi:Ubiquitin-like-specific protease 2 [Beauveria bassiana]|nr:Ubiquitin-like-specific protease 2 [Beauveria bassiana]